MKIGAIITGIGSRLNRSRSARLADRLVAERERALRSGMQRVVLSEGVDDTEPSDEPGAFRPRS